MDQSAMGADVHGQTPADLPPVLPMPAAPAPAMPPAAAPAAPPVPSTPPTNTGQLSPEQLGMYAAAEAQRILSSDTANPFRQAAALQQLKARYLADRFHIQPGKVNF